FWSSDPLTSFRDSRAPNSPLKKRTGPFLRPETPRLLTGGPQSARIRRPVARFLKRLAESCTMVARTLVFAMLGISISALEPKHAGAVQDTGAPAVPTQPLSTPPSTIFPGQISKVPANRDVLPHRQDKPPNPPLEARE